MTPTIREQFAEVARLPDEEISLPLAALLIAAEADNELDVQHYLSKLDAFATGFKEDQRFRSDYGIPVSGLLTYIHQELGFCGNIADYYDPANSYLHRVIDLKRGIPISLALIHMAIGERLNVPVSGISFPGHFLVRYGGDNGVIVDPFAGRELSRADCQNLLRQLAGKSASMKAEYFEPANPRDILIRMLDNLKQIFWRQKSWDESKACIDRQLLLLPDRTEFTVQLGAVYEMQGDTALAQHVYTSVLQEHPDNEQIRELASKRLLALEQTSKTLH